MTPRPPALETAEARGAVEVWATLEVSFWGLLLEIGMGGESADEMMVVVVEMRLTPC